MIVLNLPRIELRVERITPNDSLPIFSFIQRWPLFLKPFILNNQQILGT
jgi:hypothetical protein